MVLFRVRNGSILNEIQIHIFFIELNVLSHNLTKCKSMLVGKEMFKNINTASENSFIVFKFTFNIY